MTRVIVSYVNLFAGGPAPRCSSHASIDDADSEIALTVLSQINEFNQVSVI